MKNSFRKMAGLTVGLTVAAVLICGAQAAKPDLSGKWTLDKSASKGERLSDWDSCECQVEQNGANIKGRTEVLFSGGKGLRTFSAVIDGAWHDDVPEAPAEGQGYTFSGGKSRTKAEWNGDRLIVQSAMEGEDGVSDRTETWSLSPDGRTLTIEVLRKDGDGNEETSTEVYRKQ